MLNQRVSETLQVYGTPSALGTSYQQTINAGGNYTTKTFLFVYPTSGSMMTFSSSDLMAFNSSEINFVCSQQANATLCKQNIDWLINASAGDYTSDIIVYFLQNSAVSWITSQPITNYLDSCFSNGTLYYNSLNIELNLT